MSTGHTLLEVVVVLALLLVAAGVSLPALRDLRDRWAAVEAREVAAGIFARARAEAPLSGGATVTVRERPPTIAWSAPSGGGEEVDLGSRFGVAVEVAGRATIAIVDYDGLGLGRVASRTLHFRRGAADVRIVVSAYGRAARR